MKWFSGISQHWTPPCRRGGIVLLALAAIGASQAQQAPMYLKTVELSVPTSLCLDGTNGCNGDRGLAFDGSRYYVAFITTNTTPFHGAIAVFDSAGNFERAIGVGQPYGTYYSHGVASDETLVWSTNYWGGLIYEHNVATGSLVRTINSGGSITRLGYDGQSLWMTRYGQPTFYRLNPATGAVTGSFTIPNASPPGSCANIELAPDGFGGMWLATSKYFCPALGQAGTFHYTITETVPGTLVATLTASYPGFASVMGQTSNNAQRKEVLIEKPWYVAPGETAWRIPVEHYLMPPYYVFDGFYAPVQNPPATNAVNSGQTVALKWLVMDGTGNPVTDLASVAATTSGIDCSSGLSVGGTGATEVAAGASGLQNLGNGYYQFNWKTPKSYTGTCKLLKLDLGDGVPAHTARFDFVR